MLTKAHDKGWSVSRFSEQVAMQRALREQAEQLVIDAPPPELEEAPSEENGTGGKPPEVSHPVLGRIGYLRPEYRDTMTKKLAAMGEAEREEAYRRLAEFDPMFTRRLAGLPVRSSVGPDSGGAAEAKALRPAVMQLSKLLGYDPEVLADAAGRDHARELLEEVPGWAERFISALVRKSSEV